MKLREGLLKSGYTVMGIQNASGNEGIPTHSSELRFFTPNDSAEAQRMQKKLHRSSETLASLQIYPKQCRMSRMRVSTKSGFPPHFTRCFDNNPCGLPENSECRFYNWGSGAGTLKR